MFIDSTERRLIVVTDLCEIVGRIYPLPVVPEALVNPKTGERLQLGDLLELRRPDGSVAKVELYGPQWASSGKGLFIELGPSVTKDDLPLGTEIWKVGESK